MPLGAEIKFCEIPPRGEMTSRKVGSVADLQYQEEDVGASARYLRQIARHYLDTHSFRRNFLVSHRLHWLAARQQLSFWGTPSEEEERGYSLPLFDVFHRAATEVPSISVNPATMAGAPCVAGTRIPVYSILDALEDHGTFEGVIESYPRLTVEQVKDAVLFSKLVVECPVGE
jgi:uncharacterized protein (DUF433 family)